jgi:hypothetical protein
VPPAAAEDFVGGVAEAVRAGAYDVVFPAGDPELAALSRERESLPARFPYGAHEDVLRALDKVELAAAARRAGLEPVADVDIGEAPVVVKPRRTTIAGAAGEVLRLYASVAATPADAARHVEKLRAAGAQPLVQRFVEGDLLAISTVASEDGDLVGAVQQRARVLSDGAVGGSVRATTVPVDAALLAGVAGLLRDLRWVGLAQVQFIAPRDGAPQLIDLNGRFYGSLALAVAAGVNLPAIWGAVGLGRPLPTVSAARIGVRYHWLEAELRATARSPRRLPATLLYAAGARHGVWDRGDPTPGFRHAASLVSRAARRVL